MRKIEYGYSYDYSNAKPLHCFENKSINKKIFIYKDLKNYTILQKDPSGQQRLKVDEPALNSMITALVNNGWKEVYG